MKAGWSIKPLSEVCDRKPSKGEARRRLDDTDKVSFVPMNELGIHQKYFEAAETRPLSAVAGSYTYFADGDVLLAKITPCFENGKLGVARGLENGIGFGSSEFMVLRPKPELLSEYLYYFLDQEPFREVGAKAMTGAVGHKRIPPEFVEALQIPLPPLDEQRWIVAVLDKAFAGIATATANAQKNLTNARALFESYLDAHLGRAPDSSNTDIGSEVEFCFGFAFKSNGYTDQADGIRLLRGDNIVNGALRWDGVVRWPKADADAYRNFEMQSGDVVLAMDRTWVKSGLKFAVIQDADLPLLQVQRVARMRCRPSILNRYLSYQIESPAFTSYIVGIQTGLGVPHISGKQIAAFKFSKRSLPEQAELVERLDRLKATVSLMEAAYQTKLAALTELKQSLLHKAFAGELT